jgi:polysaccharide pyruvyl transferase WcaK-like protein
MLFHVHKLPVAVIDELLISFDTWLDGKYEFILFYDVSTNYKEQEKKYHELLSKIQHRSIKFELFENFNSCRDFIDGSELIVTSKLHVGIVGIATGCKVISIPTHSKTIRLYKQLGLENFCIPVRNYSIERLTIAFNSLDTFEPDFDAINLGIGKMEVVLKQFLDAK